MEFNMERRASRTDETQAYGADKEHHLSGYAARYNVLSHPIPGKDGKNFRERILPGAFNSAIGQDVCMFLNHDANLILGRTGSRTLSLNADGKGLAFDVSLPNNTWGRDAYEAVKRGDLNACSFGFGEVEDSWGQEDGFLVRTIKKVLKLFEVSVVANAAYAGTQISARNLVAAEVRSRVEAFESLTATVELTPEERLDWWCKFKGLNRTDYATPGEIHNAVYRRRMLLNSVLV